jgi:parallel beta-helix repeat protein
VGSGQPYATIQAAVNAAQAGDTVVVHDGNYAGFSVSRSGTAGKPLVIRTAGTGTVINQANSSGEGITLNNASYVTIDGFTVSGMSNYGLATHNAGPTSPMRGLVIRNNTVRDSGSANIYLSEVADSLVEGNSASGSKASHGIYLANGGSDNTTLRANRCFGNFKNGIHLNGDQSIGGDGLHTGINLDGNVLYANTDNGMDIDGMQDSTIQNNLVYGNGRNAVRVFQIDAAGGPRNLRIVNNTLSVPSGGGWAVKFTEDGGGHVIFNNILWAESGASGSLAVANTTFTSDSNIVVDRLSIDGDNSVISLASWKARGQDAASLLSTASALFISPTADFRLKVGSPAENTGRANLAGVASPGADIVGVARPAGGAVDIGAYEGR